MVDKTYTEFPEEMYAPDEAFGLAAVLSRIYRVQYATLNKMLREQLGIGCIHYLPLANVWRAPGVSQKDLAQMLSISKAMVSQSLKELEQCGYIERRINPHDRRNNMIYLTATGERMIEACVKIHRQINNEITADLSHNDIHLVSDCLNHMLMRALDISVEHTQPDEGE